MPLTVSYEPPRNRRMDALAPAFRTRLVAWLAAARERLPDISIQVTETRRTLARQRYLYSLGRTAPGKVVTWTLESKHRWGLAADIVIVRGGKAVWDAQAYQTLYRTVRPSSYALKTLEGDLVHLEAADSDELIRRAQHFGLFQT